MALNHPYSNPIKEVLIAVEFIRIGEIDTINEKYQAEVNIESKWTSNETIDQFDPKKHWHPALFIENALTLTKDTVKYEVRRQVDGTCIIIEKRNAKGVFWERLELHNFPIDIQELSVTISSKLDLNSVKLVSDPYHTSLVTLNASHTFVDQQKWRLFRLVDLNEKASYDTDKDVLEIPNGDESDEEAEGAEISHALSRDSIETPKIVATCYCSRKSGYYVFNAFFLIFLITISSITIFAISCKLPQNRLQTSYTLLLTSVSFKWVINRSLPTVSYLTSLDQYAITCIFFICSLCVWHSIVGSNWTADYACRLDKWLLLVFSIVFILIHLLVFVKFYMGVRKVQKLKKKEKQFLKELGHQADIQSVKQAAETNL